MLTQNQTIFLLLGLSPDPTMQTIIFVGILFIYILSLLGNCTIICATYMDQKLHIPMYILLSSLAIVDICFLSSTAPNLLASMARNDGRISHSGCLLQFYFYYSFGGTEFCSLALLSIDRYLAVCYPLRYSAIMTRLLCGNLIFGSWIFGFLEFLPTLFALLQLKFCRKVIIINHFLCDGSTLLTMSCSNRSLAGNIFLSTTTFGIVTSLVPTFVSYGCIFSSILRISASNSRIKTFSTCSSHLFAVFIIYGSCIFIYIRPIDSLSTSLNTTVAVFNSIFIPVLNPFIYTLRNQMIKNSLGRFVKKIQKHS